MSDWNSLENTLRKWTPRRPSPELRRRLFQPAPAAGARPAGLAEFTRWLVPAFGCFLLVIGSLSSRYSPHGAFAGAVTNLVLSDYRHAYPAGRTDHSGINSLPAQRLEWNFGARSAVAAAANIETPSTNALIQ